MREVEKLCDIVESPGREIAAEGTLGTTAAAAWRERLEEIFVKIVSPHYSTQEAV